MEYMQFELSENQQKQVNEWYNRIKQPILEDQKKSEDEFTRHLANSGIVYAGCVGGNLSYEITPTSIGTIVKVKEMISGEELDISEDFG